MFFFQCYSFHNLQTYRQKETVLHRLPLELPLEYWIEQSYHQTPLIMSNLYSQLEYPAVEFQAMQLIVLVVVSGVVDYSGASGMWVYFLGI